MLPGTRIQSAGNFDEVTGKPYTHTMSTQQNVTPIITPERQLRRARGEFVKNVIVDEHERSARFVAVRIGLSPSTMGERLNGKSPFLADELESIARVLKIDPIEFYSRYIQVGPAGFEPTTSTVEVREFDDQQIAPVTSIFGKRSA